MRTRRIRSLFITALLTASAALAAFAEESRPAGLHGPVMGYVHDARAKTIRPLNGIPGSSSLGQPLALPLPIAVAAFSPRSDYALAISDSDRGAVYVVRNLEAIPDIDRLGIGINGADRLFLNTDGSAAVLLASDARQLQVLRGLPLFPTFEE